MTGKIPKRKAQIGPLEEWDALRIIVDPTMREGEFKFVTDDDVKRVLGTFQVPEEDLRGQPSTYEQEQIDTGRMKKTPLHRVLDMVLVRALDGPLRDTLLVVAPNETELPYVVFRTHKGAFAYAWEQAAGRHKTMRWMRDWRNE